MTPKPSTAAKVSFFASLAAQVLPFLFKGEADQQHIANALNTLSAGASAVDQAKQDGML